MPVAKPRILLVEDNRLDVLAFTRGVERHDLAIDIVVAENGRQALDIMRGDGGHDKLPRPYLIFLDLNMPIMTGLEFLAAIRDDEELKETVVFVLTTSDHEDDLEQAYAKQVAGYILKPNLSDACKLIEAYTQVVELRTDA